ncbi:UNVERIFIED_CONTAM: Acid phosphatase 1 [Sesamum latifolium]|uniref:Acid phosphatase 1 n=1 Tax=Sesamum latifolium TaxID=2727402 RepID=A0AAW2UEZ6_9LAMI
MGLPIFIILATLVSTSHAGSADVFNPIRLFRPRSGSGGLRAEEVDCQSWQLAVETNNLQRWKLVPASCGEYVGQYMLGQQYSKDCDMVADVAIEYAKSLKLAGDGKEIWVFDVVETTLSNLPYYARPDVQFGTLPYNRTNYYEWLMKASAPPVPAVLRLYNTLLSLGIKPVFITGTSESLRDITTINLHRAGYYFWEKLILN